MKERIALIVTVKMGSKIGVVSMAADTVCMVSRNWRYRGYRNSVSADFGDIGKPIFSFISLILSDSDKCPLDAMICAADKME